MPFAVSKGVKLYYEVTGKGRPIIFVHEFAGDCRSWEPQVRYFSRLYRCITFNARGYPPSDVPKKQAAYGQDISTDDVAAVLSHLKIEKSHVVGLSMGAHMAVNFAIRHPRRTRSIVVAGAGFGSIAEKRKEFIAVIENNARTFEREGAARIAKAQGLGPLRIQFRSKDPRGWEEFVAQYAEHSAEGSARTQRGVQKARPSLYRMERKIRRIAAPALIITGDEDEPCLEPSLFLKRVIPRAGLWIFPKSGHAVNLEEPDWFNEACHDFFALVEQGRWDKRDPRARVGSAL
ncbi:MAG: alpha/beta hydrolase [Rhodospirillales bacterium]|nr:alpha/beta hydrolase [Rhodospirillales bacterium]